MKIEEMGLSVRAYNCLKRKGYDTTEQIQAASDEELLRIRSFGVGCLEEVREKLGKKAGNIPEKPYRQERRSAVGTKTIYVEEKMEKAIKTLNAEYEKAKENPVVRDPVAWALYQTWRRAERE